MDENILLNKKGYDLIAKNYKDEHHRLEYENELLLFKSYLSKNIKNILDLGCGPADDTIWLGNNNPTEQVIGIDISHEMLQLNTNLPPNVHLENTNMLTYVPHTLFQGIWARASIHHLTKSQIYLLFKNFTNYLDSKGIIGMINKY